MPREPVPCGRRSPSFFKVLVGDFTTHLKIPPAYVKQVKCFSKATNSCNMRCILIRRNHANDPGKMWHVFVKTVNKKLCFTNGWPQFFRDNFLELGDFLLFKYIGELQFVVKIYDMACCEKLEPSHGNAFSNVISISRDDDDDDENGQYGDIEAATKFLSQSKCPAFKIAVTESYLKSGYMAHERVKIEVLDKSWEMGLTPGSESRGRLSKGWRQCAMDNCLKPGDVCVFQLLNNNDSVLKLSIFRNNI